MGEGVDPESRLGRAVERDGGRRSCAELLASATGIKTCHVMKFDEAAPEREKSRTPSSLRSGDRAWTVLVRDGAAHAA